MSSRHLSPMRIAALVALLMVAARLGGCHYVQLLDLRVGIDFRLLQRGPQPGSDEVVVVAVDDDSIKSLGRWPWSPARMAKLLDRIAAGTPAAVGFDVVWSERSSPEEEAELARSIGAAGRVALGYFFDCIELRGSPVRCAESNRRPLELHSVHNERGDTRGLERLPAARDATVNLPALTQSAKEVGYFNFLYDADGFFRRGPLAIRHGEQTAIPLSLAMLRARDPKRPLGLTVDSGGAVNVTWGNRIVPVAEDGQLLINFRGGADAFRQVPAHEILAGKTDPAVFRDRFVLVGVTATAVTDVRNTVFDAQLPGVLLHANILDNVLRGEFLQQPYTLTLVLELAAIVLLVLLLGNAMRRLRGVSAALIAFGLAALYLAASQWLFLALGIVMSAAFPTLGVALTYFTISLYQFLVVEQQRRQFQRMLELYLSPAIARIMSEQPERILNVAEKRDLTVLFSDIRGFTTISEGMGPAVVPLLNDYLAAMSDVIYRYDGGVRYVGDAILAWWNAPLAQDDHAQRGCRVALGMIARLRELEGAWAERGWPPIRIGIGLNSGPMVFGSLGSTNHLSFEIVGDDANLGARLEGLTKQYGCTTIASEVTVSAARDLLAVRELDVVRVKGKEKPVRIFEILGPAEERPRWLALADQFERALAAYRAQRWTEAQALFEEILAARPEDGPAALFVKRCQAMALSPPPPDWDGVTVMESK